MKLIECVPNFSEGSNKDVIKQIITVIESVHNITLLDVDSGINTNRTVVTFIGDPSSVVEAAFLAIEKASQLIDMNKHKGQHARMGSTDVCPFIPISNVSIDECIKYSNILAEKVSKELEIPIFLYELSAKNKNRTNLADIRDGEYEGLSSKLQEKGWEPDYGNRVPHPTSGATVIGVRNFLIAYNINLNTKDKKIATDIALDIREQGRNKRNKNGKFIRDKYGIPIKKPGKFKSCKAVGWFIEEYGQAQVSINLTNFKKTGIHNVFDEIRKQANKRGVRVTGSEIVGLIPLDSIISSGQYYLKKQNKSTGIPEINIIEIAIKSLGLNDITPFIPSDKIIEYKLKNESNKLVQMKIDNFIDELSSDSPAPGGGSVSALSGALAAALTAMVANLTFGKKKWSKLYTKMCTLANNAQNLKYKLLKLIDKDTDAFNKIVESYKLSDSSEKNDLIEISFKNATDIPFNTLKLCIEVLNISIIAANA